MTDLLRRAIVGRRKLNEPEKTKDRSPLPTVYNITGTLRIVPTISKQFHQDP